MKNIIITVLLFALTNSLSYGRTMNDTLYWNEMEVLPGSFIGNWDILSVNGGVEEPIVTSIDDIQSLSEKIKVIAS